MPVRALMRMEDDERFLSGLERVAASWLTLSEVGLVQSVSRRWWGGVSSEVVWLEQYVRRKLATPYVPSNMRLLNGIVETLPKNFKAARESNEIVAMTTARERLYHYVLDEGRTKLKLHELIGLEWNFRFKETAGESWTSVDPYWQDLPATSVRFRADGTTCFCKKENFDDSFCFLDDVNVEWRWGDSQSTAPASGTWPNAKIRARVDGQDVPSYIVSRHPVHKGFMMQSCWVLYTAFPMPPKGTDPFLEDDALRVGWADQAREALAYNTAQRVSNGFLDFNAFDTILRGAGGEAPFVYTQEEQDSEHSFRTADIIARFLLQEDSLHDFDEHHHPPPHQHAAHTLADSLLPLLGNITDVADATDGTPSS